MSTVWPFLSADYDFVESSLCVHETHEMQLDFYKKIVSLFKFRNFQATNTFFKVWRQKLLQTQNATTTLAAPRTSENHRQHVHHPLSTQAASAKLLLSSQPGGWCSRPVFVHFFGELDDNASNKLRQMFKFAGHNSAIVIGWPGSET